MNYPWARSVKKIAFDHAPYSRIAESRRSLVFPLVISTIVDSAPESVFDFGGGDGEFLRLLRDQFQGQLSYFDPDQSAAEIASRRLRELDVEIVGGTSELPVGRVDAVVSNAVWMTLKTDEDCVEYLRVINRALKPEGRGLISVTHPCFREERFSTFAAKFDLRDYLADGLPFTVSISDGEHSIEICDYHWSLSAMLRQLKMAGLSLVGLNEISDLPSGSKRGAPWLLLEVVRR